MRQFYTMHEQICIKFKVSKKIHINSKFTNQTKKYNDQTKKKLSLRGPRQSFHSTARV